MLQLTVALTERQHRVRVLAPITADTLEFDASLRRSLTGVRLTRYVVPNFDFERADARPDETYRSVEGKAMGQMLPRLIAEERPDIIVAGQERMAWYVPEIAWAHGIPCVLLLRGSPTWRIVEGSFPAQHRETWLKKARAADWIIAVAKYFERGLLRFGVTNLSSIPNHVDLARFAPAPKSAQLLRDLRLTEDDLIVMHASKLDWRKRPLDIVAAADAVARSCPDMRFVIAGEGEQSRQMKEACCDKGLANRFRFLGWVPYERMPSLLNLADVVVQPSEGEGLARVYLEAMACGRLLVASDIPAAREVIRHGENGLLFPKADVQQLSATLVAARDPRLRARLGRAARNSVKGHSLAAVTDRYVRLFRDVIAGRLKETPRTHE